MTWNASGPHKATKAKRQRRRADTTPAMIWLRNLTFQDIHGLEMIENGQRKAIPSMRIATYTDRRNRVRFPGGFDPNKHHGGFKVANYKFRDHFDRRATYYYFGHPTAARTLVKIDIDARKALGLGSPAGAVAFATHLKKFWPGLYTEPSTGGIGVHGYLVLERAGHSAEEVNAFLKRLQDWLRAEQAITNADIEIVEVKGRCPVISMTPGGRVEAVRFGTFAKIPRQADERFEELAATTVLDIDQPLPANSGPAFKLVQPKGGAGSWDGRFVSDGEVAMIPAYEQFYRNLGPALRDRRYIVSANDFAVFCVLLRWFTSRPEKVGKKKDTLPVRKVEGLWNSLHEAGTAERPFNCHRFKVIRDYLSRSKHIDWIDHHYQWTERDEAGQVVTEGVACKWRLTDHFSGLLDQVFQTGGGDFVVIEEFKKGTGKHQVPTPRLIEQVDKTSSWILWATERLENDDWYSLAA